MGEVFAGRYELVDLLGDGGMGSVWRVWDRRDHAYRAAKVLKQSDSVSLLRFVRETSWRVEHPHVLVPLGWVGEDDRVLFTMPIAAGGSLATVLADHGVLDPAWAVIVLDQVLDALAAVHDAGIVHRDVKPANVLLEATGSYRPHAWLSDFGIAVAEGEPRLTRTHEVVGTRGYQPPETELGDDPEPSHDLYAVGVMLREMVGDRPEAAELVAALTGPADSRPRSAAAVRTALAAIVWTPEPHEPVEVFDQRPPLPEGWTPDGPGRTPVAPVAPVPRPPRPPRSRPTVRAEVVVAGLLGVLGVGLIVAAILAL
ncbi:MAG: serine/threonine-protein kinase [Aeromicrobium erythreum]